MSATQNGTASEATVELTTLADCIEHVDGPVDTRDCPHDCHGNLSLTDDEEVICETCRCTPDGEYISPEERTWVSQPRGWLFSRPNPKGERLQNHPPDERERYRGSNLVRLYGGRTCLYDADDEERPDGVTEEYTFDLPLLTV
jgi:hypothetical protein